MREIPEISRGLEPSDFLFVFIIRRANPLNCRLDEICVRRRGLQVQCCVEGGQGRVWLPKPLVHLTQLEPDARLPRCQVLLQFWYTS